MKRNKCEVCSACINVDIHHIHSKSLGGPNVAWNRCELCPNCHRLVHTGKLILEGRFLSTVGLVLVWRENGQDSITGFPDPPVWKYNDVILKIVEMKTYNSEIFCVCFCENSNIMDLIL